MFFLVSDAYCRLGYVKVIFAPQGENFLQRLEIGSTFLKSKTRDYPNKLPVKMTYSLSYKKNVLQNILFAFPYISGLF